MENKINFSAARATALVFGILAGLGGLTHRTGEVLQGSVKPGGIIINSWTQGPIATNTGGEPGMIIVPNLLITGLLVYFFDLNNPDLFTNSFFFSILSVLSTIFCRACV